MSTKNQVKQLDLSAITLYKIRDSHEAELSEIDAQFIALQTRKEEIQTELTNVRKLLGLDGPPLLEYHGHGSDLPEVEEFQEHEIVTVDNGIPKQYDKKASLRVKMQWAINKAGQPLTSDEIKEAILKKEPDNDKIGNITTIISQNKKIFIRINPGPEGGKPKFGLAK